MKKDVDEKIQDYLASYVSKKSMDKGLSMYKHGDATLKNVDQSDGGNAIFKVKSNSGYGHYEVNIDHFNGNRPLKVSCSCPYDWGGACKHIVAALLELDEMDIIGPATVYSMLDCEVSLHDLGDTYLKTNTSAANWTMRQVLPKTTILSASNGIAECSMKSRKDTFTMRFIRIAPGHLHTSCSCAQELPEPLCMHKLAGLIVLREEFGIMAFESMRDWSAEKNQLLAAYGYSIEDDLNKKFEFKINNLGQLELKVLDSTIRSTTDLKTWQETLHLSGNLETQVYKVPKIADEDAGSNTVLIFAFTQQPGNTLPDVVLSALTARYNPVKDKISHLSKLDKTFGSYDAALPVIAPEDSKLINFVKKSFLPGNIAEAIRKAGGTIPRWYYNLTPNDLNEETLRLIQIHIGSIWEQVFPMLQNKIAYTSPNSAHLINSMHRVQVSASPARIHLTLNEKGTDVILECSIAADGAHYSLRQVQRYGFWLLCAESKMMRFASWKDAALLQQFGPTGQISVRTSQLEGFLNDFVLPMAEHFAVNLNIDKPVINQSLSFKQERIYLKEDEENLLFVPGFAYHNDTEEGLEFSVDGRQNKVHYADGNITIQQRDPDAEKAQLEFLESLHPDFQKQSGQGFYYLPFGEILKDNWLFRFFEETAAREMAVFGFAQLKKFKYNPNRPSFNIRASSGIDWFDMKMELSFGDQFVSLNDIKKAVINKQNYVQLADGTIGMLPEEWLNKYASLFKFGQVKNDSIQVSKLHFSIIDELYDQIDDEKVQQEIMEKKSKLLHFKEIKDVQLPQNRRAQLRDYQVEGYKWLSFLEEFSWGGCLADDMGLGKTIQVLTFLQAQKEAKPGATNLVVVPTTLIFNWQAEVEKFAPEMQVFVHRGIDRSRETAHFGNYDIILTTYGTLRSDIEFLKTFVFNYIVLDESQAIKNPLAQVSKAVKLLVAQNRLAMTGTPVENNTFDLYSQMDFLNPGLLGSQDFFRTEFATPIDKHRDEHAANALRKLIYPFILKRTKDEVAKDLPDKTEMTLFCEMGKKQRKVYDIYRELYRQKIADKIALDGKEKAAFLVLEGLLKLRQICDSPALLSDDADYGDDSAKLDEIIRELEENAGHHKILIFSQFLKMLDLIKQHLEKAGIPYEYLDGATTNRAQRVNRFQESDHCRVFLMSLKAGGVGINLTEADYVYLIDPWWNPAVEQQAIDRTHRIGQTKKVFAYKMICKDTIEEKILILQEKKKGIAQELISTEQGFIKKLSKDDIVGLFS